LTLDAAKRAPSNDERGSIDNTLLNSVRRWSCDDVARWKDEQNLAR